jgi:hypothetical protein
MVSGEGTGFSLKTSKVQLSVSLCTEFSALKLKPLPKMKSCKWEESQALPMVLSAH